MNIEVGRQSDPEQPRTMAAGSRAMRGRVHGHGPEEGAHIVGRTVAWDLTRLTTRCVAPPPVPPLPEGEPSDGASPDWRRAMTDTARVVVIGGGIVGASVLYHLARGGSTDAVLVERAELASGSTWHAAGNAALQHKLEPLAHPLGEHGSLPAARGGDGAGGRVPPAGEPPARLGAGPDG